MKALVTMTLATLLLGMSAATAIEYHVSQQGNDLNDGAPDKPFRSISAAAQVAQPGDVITVHAGVYRERVSPPRGGTSEAAPIVYQAAPGEQVEIKGSEVITNWVAVQDAVWKVTLPNSFFGAFNPYSDVLHGDWFNPKGRIHHTGAVYLNGAWLMEAATLDEVLKPTGSASLWFAQVDASNTSIWAHFGEENPNEALTEINVRQTVFYPEAPGINYLTVRGFTLRHAATPWVPPTAEQIGLLGTHWSKGWIIENNLITHSKCAGISLGKYGDQWDNTSADTAEGYVKTIERALQRGWNKATIGHHTVRNNTIAYCEQAGIVGSLGAVFSRIEDNIIHDIHVQELFTGAEMAGIKIHAAIDVELRHNHIYRTCRGLWLDWMAQGTRVSGNLFHDNAVEDLFVEVNHGPFLVDNNLFLSPVTLNSRSQGGAYVHNLIAGETHPNTYDERLTPFHKAHSTELAGMHDNPCGDDRYYNNLFIGPGDLRAYDTAKLPVWMNGNVFLGGAAPCKLETGAVVQPNLHPALRLVEKPDGFYLELSVEESWRGNTARKAVDTNLLGTTTVSRVSYENPDGTPIQIDTDYFRKERDPAHPTPGPFEKPRTGPLSIKVW
ncbi:MAG: right-handed parallel beta-helix repeat-containing protein [Candidatus Hydrogenedentes bacterium]|nr:right-handed parallel beta-helix repeat-containing protein [Candidatus Hydrogenedentota bacterium]